MIEDHILTEKELALAEQEQLTNPILRKLLNNYNISHKSIYSNFREAVLLNMKEMTTLMNAKQLSLKDEHWKAFSELLKSLSTISTGLSKLEAVSEGKDSTEGKIEKKSEINIIDEARKRALH